MVQEFAAHRLQRTGDRARSIQEAEDVAELVTLISFDARILSQALKLMRSHSSMRARDAVHAATALACGIEYILSPNPDFDGIPGLTRVTLESFLNSQE
jgi:predicted nucleic acid-binding protein